MTTDDTLPTKRSGRRTETPAQRLARLERDVHLARQAVKEHQQRTLATLGTAVVMEAKEQPVLMTTLRDLLKRRLPNKPEQADILTLLEG